MLSVLKTHRTFLLGSGFNRAMAFPVKALYLFEWIHLTTYKPQAEELRVGTSALIISSPSWENHRSSTLLSAATPLLCYSVFIRVLGISFSSVVLLADFNHMNCLSRSFSIYSIQSLLFSINLTLRHDWNLPFRAVLLLKCSLWTSYFLSSTS